MDSSRTLNSLINGRSENIPLNEICYSEDCPLTYIHNVHNDGELVNRDSRLVQVAKTLVFCFFGINFLACFWVYTISLVLHILHFFGMNVVLHLPFNIHLPL